MRYIIVAPPYDENSGGCIVLHKLCHLLNELGYEAYLTPYLTDRFIGLKKLKSIIDVFRELYLYHVVKMKFNPKFNTNILKGDIFDTDIVIYPETVFGNPLNAKNVVRWMLNKPGYFTNEVCYGQNELYFKFDHGLIEDFSYYNSVLSKNILNVLHIPIEHYNQDNLSKLRSGCAYSVRKGKGKVLNQHPKEAICIDGLNHAEVSKIFKSVSRFISYDTYSAYSLFARLCGCEVIVIPDEGISKEDWYPDERLRYGLAYGFEDIQWARNTRHLVQQFVDDQDKNNRASVSNFALETIDFFSIDPHLERPS